MKFEIGQKFVPAHPELIGAFIITGLNPTRALGLTGGKEKEFELNEDCVTSGNWTLMSPLEELL